MPLYVQLDVEYFNDPKLIEAGPYAELIYVRALCFAKRTMNDGHITRSQLAAFTVGVTAPLRHVQRLVEVDAWCETTDGWQIVAWLKRNKSAARIASDMAAKRLKSLLGNHKRWHLDEGKFDPTCELCNPSDDPYRHPRGDRNGDRSEESTKTEVEPEEQVETEPESVPPDSHGDTTEAEPTPADGRTDGFDVTVELIVEEKCRYRTIDHPASYKLSTRTDTVAVHGELIRRMLADGTTPEQCAAFVLVEGHRLTAMDAHPAQGSSVPWCDDGCPICEPDSRGWIETCAGMAPCPGRTRQVVP